MPGEAGQDSRLEVRLNGGIPDALADEVSRRLLFVSPDIEGFELRRSNGAIDAVLLTVSDHDVDAGRLGAKVRAMIDDEVRTQLPHRRDVVWCSKRAPEARPIKGRREELTAAGHIFDAGPGQVALGPLPLHLLDRLDSLLTDIAVRQLGGYEYRYPTLLPTAALRRSGYATSFPQHVMFATHLHADLEVYQEFADAERAGGQSPGILAYCRDAEHCLPPTMCYHTFRQLADRPLARDTVVTARGKSFRHEGRYHAGLERLWDFTIREIVFVGSRDFARGMRTRYLSAATSLLDALDLAGTCEVAHDPFFGGPGAAQSTSSQRLLALKYEARLHVDGDRTIAVGSFNRHDQRFGDAFGITGQDGKPVHSACVGFGLERLCYAVLCQHGIDPGGWPDLLRPVTAPGPLARQAELS